MASFEQIIADGANGVTQAPRVVPFIPAWQAWSTAGAILLGALSLRRMGRPGAVVLMCLSFVPGYWQIFGKRADAPSRQESLAATVERVQAAYVARARAALSDVPPGTCYEPVRDAACIPYGGLHDAEAWKLGAARRCIGAERSRVRLIVSECSTTDLALKASIP